MFVSLYLYNFKTEMIMITEWIERIKRKHNCKAHFLNDSFQMKDCIVAPVHLIPEEIYDNQEFDFYIRTKYDVYLLRIINNESNCGIIYPAKMNGIIYIVSNLPISKNNITESIQKTLNRLEEYGFPNLKNSKCKIAFQME